MAGSVAHLRKRWGCTTDCNGVPQRVTVLPSLLTDPGPFSPFILLFFSACLPFLLRNTIFGTVLRFFFVVVIVLIHISFFCLPVAEFQGLPKTIPNCGAK